MVNLEVNSMPDYRRWYVPGGTFFFTVVTCERRPILVDEFSRMALRNAIEKVRRELAFQITAIVLLPDHVHAIWTLPPNDSNYPLRWKRIKELFSRAYLEAGGVEVPVNASREHKGERGIWQRRYWEHTIEDEDDLKGCVDYVHWNPKKHRYVTNICDWRWSSFHRFVQAGEYTLQWGAEDPCRGYDAPEWGE
jgi:putative transposase